MNIQYSLDNITFVILFIVTLSYLASIGYTEFIWFYKFNFYGTILLLPLLGLRWLNYGSFPLSNQYESLLFFVWEITSILIGFKELGKTRIFLIVGSILICYLYQTHDLINLNLLP